MKTHISFMNKHCTLMFVLFCSFISFIYTDDKSPANLEDTCFDIDNTSLSKMVIKSSKCYCHNSFAKKKNQHSCFFHKKDVYHLKYDALLTLSTSELLKTKIQLLNNRSNKLFSANFCKVKESEFLNKYFFISII